MEERIEELNIEKSRENPHAYLPIFLVWRQTLHGEETETWTPTKLQNPPPTRFSAFKMYWSTNSAELVGVANPCLT